MAECTTFSALRALRCLRAVELSSDPIDGIDYHTFMSFLYGLPPCVQALRISDCPIYEQFINSGGFLDGLGALTALRALGTRITIRAIKYINMHTQYQASY